MTLVILGYLAFGLFLALSFLSLVISDEGKETLGELVPEIDAIHPAFLSGVIVFFFIVYIFAWPLLVLGAMFLKDNDDEIT